MKTIREWLNELPEPYRSLALKNAESEEKPELDKFTPTVDSAIIRGFVFYRTPQGSEFWWGVCNHFEYGSPLPEFPKNNEL